MRKFDEWADTWEKGRGICVMTGAGGPSPGASEGVSSNSRSGAGRSG